MTHIEKIFEGDLVSHIYHVRLSNGFSYQRTKTELFFELKNLVENGVADYFGNLRGVTELECHEGCSRMCTRKGVIFVFYI